MSQQHHEPSVDQVRHRLLDAAARVFAAKGYEGTKIGDIVAEAGLSTGAVYGRFSSKNDLLRQAVVRRAPDAARLSDHPGTRVADLIARSAVIAPGPLSDDEAVRLEASVAARRHPEVASALADAQADLRRQVQPLVDAAVADGTVAQGVDPEAVLYLVRTVQLGLLAQRAAGAPAPEPDAWDALVARIVASFGQSDPDVTDRASHTIRTHTEPPPNRHAGEPS
ncbi:MAG: TetR/AcrR family transcriptional regulator [Acidimicrobiia bacterium]|nr:TetR/AcrR family transcriptional regulator [Acidimicrobiia bacterium]